VDRLVDEIGETARHLASSSYASPRRHDDTTNLFGE
jgi:hypothetical protein